MKYNKGCKGCIHSPDYNGGVYSILCGSCERFYADKYETCEQEFNYKVIIPLKPMPAPRPRVTRYGTYNDPKYTQYKKDLLRFVSIQNKTTYPVEMIIEFMFRKPKSWTNKKKIETKYHTSKPDIDNLIKTVQDSLNGVAYIDDSQVTKVTAYKIYGEENKTTIIVKNV